MRWFLLATLAIACSTGSSRKRDDGATVMPSSPDQPRPAAPTAKVHLATPRGDVVVNVEVVATEPKIRRGLMFRQFLPPDDGMLFLMGEERDWAFWMQNTLIPLDMIFIRKDFTIAGVVQNAEPKTETLRKVGEKSLYVLEVNAGFTASRGVAANQPVKFEGVQGI